MFRIFTKERIPQEIFNVNLTREEVEGNNIDIWIDHQDLNQDDYIVTYNEDFEYPILKDGMIEEMTREEKVANDIPVNLNDGEIIKNKKIITIPLPKDLYQPKWNGEEWEEGADRNSLIQEKKKKVLKLRKLKEEINTLKEIAEIDEELADLEMIEMTQKEYDLLKFEILELNKIIKSLQI